MVLFLLKEQQKNQQLETHLKDKDIKLRAALEENDILTFNNTQLTKKVTALQTTIQEVSLNNINVALLKQKITVWKRSYFSSRDPRRSETIFCINNEPQ